MEKQLLRRTIGLPLLSLYGLGTILGAGIYVLIGEVVAVAGNAAPTAFVLAGTLAGVTAFSFAELSARIPRSAGEAAYVEAAFGRRALTVVVGWAVVAVGTVSAATMVRGFIGYLGVFVALPEWPVILILVASLTALAVWGIAESLLVAAAITALEIAGLAFIIVIAGDSVGEFTSRWPQMLPELGSGQLVGVVSGAFIAFYAFIGFEDMVNVAEEVKNPGKNMPRAIMIALVTATSLYLLVAVVATLAVPRAELAGSSAPLAVIAESRGYPPAIIAVISLFAVLNGALVQIIMASRVLYGLADQKLAWAGFRVVNTHTRTPVLGTLFIGGALVVLSALVSLGGLARMTSFIALSVFTLVNVALLQLKRKPTRYSGFAVPAPLPAAGAALCIAMIAYEASGFLR